MENDINSTEFTTFERDLSLTVGILLLIIALGSIIANALLLTAIYCDPYKCFRTTPIIFIANLALADLLTGLVVDPLYAVYNIAVFENKHYDEVLTVGDYGSYITVNNAILTIVVLIIDRSVAIRKPFFYRRVMTSRTAAIIVVVSWIYSVFFSTFRLMGMSDKVYVLLDTHLHVTFAFLSLSCLFTFIYLSLKMEKRKKLREACASGENNKNAAKENRQDLKTDKRLLVTIFLILFIFFITYSPYAVFIHLDFYCTSCQHHKSFFFLSKISEPAVYFNSLLNPFIYAWRHKNFRKALLWVVKCPVANKKNRIRELGTFNRSGTIEERDTT